MSRAASPKQLISLVGEKSLLQQTLERVSDRSRFSAPMIIASDEHRFVVAEQCRAVGIQDVAILLEPCGRNTAPALAAAALASHSQGLILVLAADHLISRQDQFMLAVEQAAQLGSQGYLVTFGMTPTYPETGYGYIALGEKLAHGHRIEKFIEKPNLARAQELLAQGGYCWNSGMFLFPVAKLLTELEQHAAPVMTCVRAAFQNAQKSSDFLRLGQADFERAPSISIDYAVMEKTSDAAVIPCDLGWNDIGSWLALWEVGEKDGHGNVAVGDVVSHDCQNSYLRSGKRLMATAGIQDLVVVDTESALLVAAKDRSQDVKKIVDRLREDKRWQADLHPIVHRPWGTYQSLDQGQNFQVKHLQVKPSAKLSYQYHHHRAEHWVVVGGEATIIRDGETNQLGVNRSTYIPAGCKHSLQNLSDPALDVIEVQTGGYLGEDDIVRLDDQYGRIK